jgi:hypothetical protein
VGKGTESLMKLFGQFVRTTVNLALLPVAVVKDIVTLGGVLLDERPATGKAIERLKDESSE